MPTIQMFEGDYLDNEGYPHILLTVEPLGDASHGVMVYVIIQRLPVGGFSVEATAIKDRTSARLYHDIDVSNVEAFLAEEGKEWIKRTLHQRQQVARAKQGITIPPKEYEIRGTDWKDSLKRLRYRGLSEHVMETITELTQVSELKAHLNLISSLQPIVAKAVPAR